MAKPELKPRVDDAPRVAELTKKADQLAADEQQIDAALAANGYKQRDPLMVKRESVRQAQEQNRSALAAARADASRRLAESRKPEYVGIVKRMKSAIEAVLAASADEVAFRDRADADGLSITNGVISPMALNTYALSAWLAEAREFYAL